MLHFPKVVQVIQIRNKGLINYHENAEYYNIASPRLIITERKNKNTRINNNKNLKPKNKSKQN